MEDNKKKLPEQYAIDVLADHASRTMHVMLTVILVLCVMLVASVGVVLLQHKQFTEALQREHALYVDLLESIETTETYELDIEQNADDQSSNVWVGRDYYGSDAKDQSQSDEDPNP